MHELYQMVDLLLPKRTHNFFQAFLKFKFWTTLAPYSRVLLMGASLAMGRHSNNWISRIFRPFSFLKWLVSWLKKFNLEVIVFLISPERKCQQHPATVQKHDSHHYKWLLTTWSFFFFSHTDSNWKRLVRQCQGRYVINKTHWEEPPW